MRAYVLLLLFLFLVGLGSPFSNPHMWSQQQEKTPKEKLLAVEFEAAIAELDDNPQSWTVFKPAAATAAAARGGAATQPTSHDKPAQGDEAEQQQPLRPPPPPPPRSKDIVPIVYIAFDFLKCSKSM